MTLSHDWLPSSGRATAPNTATSRRPGANGQFRFYRLSEQSATFDVDNVGAVTQPERQSFEVRANVDSALPEGLSRAGNVDYFSDVTVQQSYQMDFYNATLRTRTYRATSRARWGRNNVSFTYGINEVFYGDRLAHRRRPPAHSFNSRADQASATPLFFTVSSEYAALSRIEKYGEAPASEDTTTACRATTSGRRCSSRSRTGRS